MMTFLKSLTTHAKAVIVCVGMALAALALVVLDAFRAGKRAARRKQIAAELQVEKEKIDEMAHGDSPGPALHSDIMERTRRKD